LIGKGSITTQEGAAKEQEEIAREQREGAAREHMEIMRYLYGRRGALHRMCCFARAADKQMCKLLSFKILL